MSEKKINILNNSSILLFSGIRRLSARIEKRKIDKIHSGKIWLIATTRKNAKIIFSDLQTAYLFQIKYKH